MVVDPISLAMIGSGVAGGISGLLSSRSASKQQKKLMALWKSLIADVEKAGGPALAQRYGALKAIQRGFGKALGAIEGAGRTAELKARDIFEQQVGGAQQGMLSGGTFDPQGDVWARRGFGADLMRSIGAIHEATGQQKAGLFAQRGMAVAGARGDIASQYMQNALAKFGPTQALGESMTPFTQNQGGNIGLLFGGLAGLFPGSGGSGGSGGGLTYSDVLNQNPHAGP